MGQKLDKAPRGAYDAIVYIEGSEVVAEDADGQVIKSGVAGGSDLNILNSLSLYNNICILDDLVAPGEWSLHDHQTIDGLGHSITGAKLYMSNKHNITIKNLTLSSSTSHGIYLYGGCHDIDIRDIILSSPSASGVHFTVDNTIAYNIFLNHLIISNPGWHGISFLGNAISGVDNVYISNCIISNAGAGGLHEWSDGIVFSNLFSSDVYSQINISDTTVSECYESGLHFEHVHGQVNIKNVVSVENGLVKPSSVYGSGITISNANVSVTDSKFDRNSKKGILVFVNNSAMKYFDAVNCIASDNLSDGIMIEFMDSISRDHISIASCNVYRNHGSGLNFVGDDDVGGILYQPVHILNNRVSGNTVGRTVPTGNKGEISSWVESTTVISNMLFDNNCIIGNNNYTYLLNMEGAAGSKFRGNIYGGIYASYGVYTGISFYNDVLSRSSGASAGTGSEQTIAHGLAAIPTGCKAWIKYLVGTRYITEMIPFDATNIYPTVTSDLAYEWRIE